jgi:hypothetical protein
MTWFIFFCTSLKTETSWSVLFTNNPCHVIDLSSQYSGNRAGGCSTPPRHPSHLRVLFTRTFHQIFHSQIRSLGARSNQRPRRLHSFLHPARQAVVLQAPPPNLARDAPTPDFARADAGHVPKRDERTSRAVGSDRRGGRGTDEGQGGGTAEGRGQEVEGEDRGQWDRERERSGLVFDGQDKMGTVVEEHVWHPEGCGRGWIRGCQGYYC